jgi:hypothetical protein
MCVLLVSSAPTFAQKRPAPAPRIRAIANVPLGGVSVRQILPYAAKRKHYLYLTFSSGQGYRVVDVTKPEHPALVDNATIPAPVVPQEVRAIGDNLGLAADSLAAARTPEPAAPGTINILDLSDPAHPQALLTLHNVSSDFTDTKRRLIYLANPDGLTIVQYRAVPKPMPYCTSTDAMNPNANCQ